MPTAEKGGDSALGRRNPAHLAEITYTESSIHLESAPQKVGKRTESSERAAYFSSQLKVRQNQLQVSLVEEIDAHCPQCCPSQKLFMALTGCVNECPGAEGAAGSWSLSISAKEMGQVG